MDTTLKTRMAPSLGLLTVANVIREGNEVRILNENVEEIDFSGMEADMAGITVTVDTLPCAIEIASILRKRGIKVVAGGIHIRGIIINASFVFGLDGDTPDTFRHTLDWIVHHKIETVTSHILTPYPGTGQYADMLAAGRIVNFNQRDYTTSEVVYAPRSMTAEQLKEGYERIYREVYSWKNIIRRFPRHQRMAYLAFNVFYRKYGCFTERICHAAGYGRIGRFWENLVFRFFRRTARI